MALTGTLRTWHDDRGFGFIAPTGGGAELFVHISAFPRDGSRPTVGEMLTYELGAGRDGRPAAVRVFRQALGKPSTYPTGHRAAPAARRPLIGLVLLLLLVVAVATMAYTQYQDREHRRLLAETPPMPADDPSAQSSAGPYRCDGRTHCSQMTSCSEARFFLDNCPGTSMDGNHDGVPCEQQWCTSALAR